MKNYLRISVIMLLISFINLNSELKAQIIYTDIQPDTTIIAPDDSWGMYYVDINLDGQNDFLLNHHNMLIEWDYQKVEMSTEHAYAEVLCEDTYNHYPLMFSFNDTIKPGANSWFCPASGGFMIVLNENGTAGYWMGGVEDKYLAVRIKFANKWHYGWIRMDIPSNAGSYTVKDFAYNSVANQEILAGSTHSPSSINEAEDIISEIVVFPNPLNEKNIINFNHNFSNLKLSIYSINGQLIEYEENITSTYYQIKNCLTKGIYLIKFETEKGVFFTKLLVN